MGRGDAGNTEQESDGPRVPSPMVRHDIRPCSFHEVAKEERRHHRIVDGADAGQELGDQVDRRGEPHGAEQEERLRRTRYPLIAEEAAEETDEIRKQ